MLLQRSGSETTGKQREVETRIRAAAPWGRVGAAAKYGRHSSGETQIQFSLHTVQFEKKKLTSMFHHQHRGFTQ